MNKLKLFFKLFLSVLNIFFYVNAWAQPYKYEWKNTFPPEGGNFSNQEIFRVNLQTNEVDTILSDISGYEKFILNPSQTRLFLEISHSGNLAVIDPEMPDSTLKLFNTHDGTIIGVLDGPNNTMYVSGWFGHFDGDTVGLSGSYILDRNTLAIIDSTSDSEINLKRDLALHGLHNNLRSFLSSDKSSFYTFVYNDKTGIYFDVASTKTNRHTGRKQCGTLGGFVYGPSIEDERNGYAIISYETSAGFAYQQFVICDVDSGIIRSIIPFTKRADVYLSADNKYTLIEEANWDPSAASRNYLPGEYITGNIYVYESTSGKFIQHLKLPPQGEVLLFDNYPNTLYYYLPKQHRSINIDLSKLGPDTCTIKLLSSTGTPLTTGTLQYKDSTWQDATNNNDGTFTITTTRKKLSLRMTYEYGTQTKSNITVKNDTTIIFQTKNVSVNLQTSGGSPLDTGTVQYNESGWQNFGTTTNGVVTKELLPVKYKFKMTYNNASNEKTQNIDSIATVVFQTIPAKVQLLTSAGVSLDTGIVQYNSGGWNNFGTTMNGIVSKELLPAKYTFRMTYASASKDKAQDLDSNAVVVFQTINATVQLQNNMGTPLDTGTVQYNAGGWKLFGTTTNGTATKELLPNNYSFRMTYAFANKDKQQDIGINSAVIFQTVNAIVQLQNSQGTPLDTGVVQYNAGGWKPFGITMNGSASKQLLSNQYNFRMTYASINNEKVQNLDSSNTISFATVLCTVRVTNSSGQLVNNAIVTYNSGKPFGTTVNGITTKELLPANITFKVQSGKTKQDKIQDISTNNVVEFVVQP